MYAKTVLQLLAIMFHNALNSIKLFENSYLQILKYQQWNRRLATTKLQPSIIYPIHVDKNANFHSGKEFGEEIRIVIISEATRAIRVMTQNQTKTYRNLERYRIWVS